MNYRKSERREIEKDSETLFPRGFIVEHFREKMNSWGFEEVKYLDPVTGRLNEMKYVEEKLKPYLKLAEGTFGELYIPPELQEVLNNETEKGRLKVALISAIMGFGHLRPARAMEMLLMTLGIKGESVCFGDSKGKGAAKSINRGMAAGNVDYIRSSILEAVRQKMLDKDVASAAIDRIKTIPNLITVILKAIYVFNKKMYHDIVSGKPSDIINLGKTLGLLKIIDFMYTGKMLAFLRDNEFTHAINFYPLFNIALLKIYPDETHRRITVLTDSMVNPGGWAPFVPQLAERQEVISHMKDFWQGSYREPVLRTGGFPAPIAGLANARELSEKRQIKLNKNQPVTIFLPASQVTTTQLNVFEEILEGCRSLLETDDNTQQVRIIVQTGAAEMGRLMYETLDKFMADHNFSGKARDNVLLHWAPDSINAVDLFEILSGSDMPLCVGVKGSEMARMTAMLNIPHIAVGAIGYQEFWNIIISGVQGAPVIMTPKARKKVLEFINLSKEIPWEQKKHYINMVIANSVTSDRETQTEEVVELNPEEVMLLAVKMAREKIQKGVEGMPYVQRDMMLKTLAYLFSGNKDVFSRSTGTEVN